MLEYIYQENGYSVCYNLKDQDVEVVNGRNQVVYQGTLNKKANRFVTALIQRALKTYQKEVHTHA